MTLTLTTFVAGTKAKAEEVNANFSALQEAVNQKAALDGDSSQTFSVALATEDYHAVNKGQLEDLSEDLTTEINKVGTKFCVKSGNTTNGIGDLFSYDVYEITAKIAGTYPALIIVDYRGVQTIVSTTPDNLDLTGNANGEYNIFITSEGELYILNNTIYRQSVRPTMVVGDVWFNTSKEPFSCVKYTGSDDEDFLDVPLGKVTFASGAITAIETFPFNQNGYNINSQTESFRFPDYTNSTSISVNTTYTASADGWLYVETKQYSGGNVQCVVNSSLTILLSHENYSQDSSGGLAILPLCNGDTFRITTAGSIVYFKAVFYIAKGASV